MTERTISIIAAFDQHGRIGIGNELAWPRCSADFKRFRALTMGKRVVMGRKTWESLPPGGLPGRQIVVVSRDPKFTASGMDVETSTNLKLVFSNHKEGELMVAGGAEIYRQSVSYAETLYLTGIDSPTPRAEEGEVFMPPIDKRSFKLRKVVKLSVEDQVAGQPECTFYEFSRRRIVLI